jgi:hypothetical protein
VAVGPQSSLLFLVDERTGARLALKRLAPSAAEPEGLWQAGRQSFSTADLVGILEAEPERISPSALLQAGLSGFSALDLAIVGGPAEIAYFAQSAVLYERILGRVTPVAAAFFRHPDRAGDRRAAAQARADAGAGFWQAEFRGLAGATAGSPGHARGRKAKAGGAGAALEAELDGAAGVDGSLDAGLGRSAETAASKMRYQMSRLRRLAANFQLQREASLTRHAEAISQALYPGGALQERVHGAAYYFARYGFGLAGRVDRAGRETPPRAHAEMWL